MEIDYIGAMQRELGAMMQHKRSFGVDGDENATKPRLVVIRQDGLEVKLPLEWRDHKQKAAKMNALAVYCAAMDIRAVILSSDTRGLNLKTFCEHYGLHNPSSAEEYEIFETKRQEIMKRDFDSDMENMPREMFNEALMTVAYGPDVNLVMIHSYTVKDGQFVFEQMVGPDDGGRSEMFMIRRWWEEPFISESKRLKELMDKTFTTLGKVTEV